MRKVTRNSKFLIDVDRQEIKNGRLYIELERK